MALTLRHLNKITSLTSVVTCRASVKFLKPVKMFPTSQYEQQYSTKCSPNFVLCDKHLPTDNKESVNDLVMREDLLNMDRACLEELQKNCNIRFSQAAPQAKEETLFSEKPGGRDPGRAPKDKLHLIFTVLGETLPKIFIQPMDYNIYHKDVIFEDHIRNIRTEGLYNYAKQVALVRTVGHLKFAYVKFEIIKITQHPEDSTVKVRWQIKGLSAMKLMVNFWKYKVWNIKEIFDKTENWYDGFSTFYVDGDGKVWKHVADKMMPDSDRVADVKPIENIAKLALVMGIVPKISELAF